MAEPISVKPTATPVVMSETTKIVLVAAFTYAAAQFVRSDIALAAIIPAGGVVATWVWGLWHRIRTWGALRYLAEHWAPDEVAVVRKRA